MRSGSLRHFSIFGPCYGYSAYLGGRGLASVMSETEHFELELEDLKTVKKAVAYIKNTSPLAESHD